MQQRAVLTKLARQAGINQEQRIIVAHLKHNTHIELFQALPVKAALQIRVCVAPDHRMNADIRPFAQNIGKKFPQIRRRRIRAF